jgi:hypothetical protein
MLLLLLLMLLLHLIISVILNGNISFLFIDVEVKLLLLYLFVGMIEISNLILVVVERDEVVPLVLVHYSNVVALWLRSIDLIFHNSQLGRVYLSPMYLWTCNIFWCIYTPTLVTLHILTICSYLMELWLGRQTWEC